MTFDANELTEIYLNLEALQMFRCFSALPVLVLCLAANLQAANHETSGNDDSSATTLKLYFPPELISSGRNPNGFKPEIAKLYVDDLYVGDAIINLHDFVPSFRFPKSTVKLRIEMSDDRKFETKMTFLGHGSTQVLYVDLTGFGPASEATPAAVGSVNASSNPPLRN